MNRGGSQEAIGFDEVVSQLEPDDPKGMGGSVIIIDVGIRVDKRGFNSNKLTSLVCVPIHTLQNGQSTLSRTQTIFKVDFKKAG